VSQPAAGNLLDYVTVLTEAEDMSNSTSESLPPLAWRCYVIDSRQLYKAGLAPPPLAVVGTPAPLAKPSAFARLHFLLRATENRFIVSHFL
jgi:hypothetical protein